MTYPHLDDRWKLLAPVDNEEGVDSVTPNIVGIATFPYDKATATDPQEAPDVKRRRFSSDDHLDAYAVFERLALKA